RTLMLNVRIRNDQRSQALDNRRVFNDRSHGDVRSLNELDSRYADDAFEKSLQRRHIRLEVWQLLVEKHVLRRKQHTVCAFAGIHPDAFENVFQRKRATHLGCRPAELAAASAAASDFN